MCQGTQARAKDNSGDVISGCCSGRGWVGGMRREVEMLSKQGRLCSLFIYLQDEEALLSSRLPRAVGESLTSVNTCCTSSPSTPELLLLSCSQAGPMATGTEESLELRDKKFSCPRTGLRGEGQSVPKDAHEPQRDDLRIPHIDQFSVVG